ncbi:hypothetical protein [Leptolyngbya sp. Cla-17]|nr:hypothetical protein [Leptolyngbya sp. Cla-17]
MIVPVQTATALVQASDRSIAATALAVNPGRAIAYLQAHGILAF